MAIGIVNQWSGTASQPSPTLQFGQPIWADTTSFSNNGVNVDSLGGQTTHSSINWASVPISVANTAGNWLVAICSWKQVTGLPGAAATMSVADDGHNYWVPVTIPPSSASGAVRTTIWVAPSARAASLVSFAPSAGISAMACAVIEISGIGKWLPGGLPFFTQFANSASSISLPLGAPSASALIIAAGGADNSSFTTSLTGTGWTALNTVTATNGADHTSDAVQVAAYQTATIATSATIGSTGTVDLSGAICSIIIGAPAPSQVNPNWFIPKLEYGLGSGITTPPDQITWWDFTSQYLATGDVTTLRHGKQYELDQIEAGEHEAILNNASGDYTPGNPNSFYGSSGIDTDVPMRLRAIWPPSATPYYVLNSGFTERDSLYWTKDGFRGFAKFTIADVWAYYTAQLPTAMICDVLIDQPYAYWPLADGASAPNAVNQAPNNPLPLTVIKSKYGLAASTSTFGATGVSAPLVGGSNVWWQQQGLVAADTNKGACLYYQDQNLPQLSGFGITIEMLAQVGTSPAVLTQPNSDLVLMMIRSATGPMAQLYLKNPSGGTNPGGVYLAVWDKTTRARTDTVILAGSFANGQPTGFSLSLTQTSWRVIVAGGFGIVTGSCNLTPQIGWIEFGGIADKFFTGAMFNGFISNIAIYPYQLPPMRVGSHVVVACAGVPGGYDASTGAAVNNVPSVTPSSPNPIGDTANMRVERLIGYAGLLAQPRVIAPSLDIVSDLGDIGGQLSGTAINNIVQSGDNLLSADGPGSLCFFPRRITYGKATKWTFGENVASGEVPYVGDIAVEYDRSQLHNLSQITQHGAAQAVIAFAHPVSTVKRGKTTYSITAYLANTSIWNVSIAQQLTIAQINFGGIFPLYQPGRPALEDLANWIIYTFGNPALRVDSVTITPFKAGNAVPNAWLLALGGDIGDIALVQRRPQTGAQTGSFSILVRILGIEHTIDWLTGTLDVKYLLNPYPQGNLLTCDDSVLGQLNGTHPMGW